MIPMDTSNIEVDEWLLDLLLDIPLIEKLLLAISIHCDYKSAIDKCGQESANVKLGRHLKIRHKSLRDKIKHNIIALNYVRSEKILTGYLTKGLYRTVVLESLRGVRLSP